MKSTVFESGVQKALGIGRTVSLVNGRACAMSAAGATHTFSTPSRGAIHEIHCPSGLMRPPVRVGLPKNLARSISGVAAEEALRRTSGTCAQLHMTAQATSKVARQDRGIGMTDLIRLTGALRAHSARYSVGSAQQLASR
jgi:hypothetical protein